MHIPAYQINNVLKAYSKQVSQNKLNSKVRGKGLSNVTVDKISISNEGKKQGVINKVASDVVKKITRYQINEKIDQKHTGKNGEKDLNEFKYYEMYGDSKKINSFSLHDYENLNNQIKNTR